MASTLARMQEVFFILISFVCCFSLIFFAQECKNSWDYLKIIAKYDRWVGPSENSYHERDFETETAAILVTALRPRWETKQQSSWRTLRRGLSSWPKSTQGGHLFVLHLILCCRIMKRFHAFLSWLGIPKHLFNDYKVLLLTSVPTRIRTQCSGSPSLQNCLRVLSRIQNNQRQARFSFDWKDNGQGRAFHMNG